jgi:hypothetical protein
MFVCCVLSDRDLCDELLTRPDESYRLWRVVLCDQETSCDEEAIVHAGLQSPAWTMAYNNGVCNYRLSYSFSVMCLFIYQ